MVGMRGADGHRPKRDLVALVDLAHVPKAARRNDPPEAARDDDRQVTRQAVERPEIEMVLVAVRDQHRVGRLVPGYR